MSKLIIALSFMLFLCYSSLSQITVLSSPCSIATDCINNNDAQEEIFQEWLNSFGSCGEAVSGCGNIVIENDYDPANWGDYNNCGRIVTVTWTISDDCNSPIETESEQFIFFDIIEPSLTLAGLEAIPNDIEVFVDDCNSGFIFLNNQFSNPLTGESWDWPLEPDLHFIDDCDSLVTFESSHSPKDTFGLGTTKVDYIITDDCGNSMIRSFLINVVCQSTLEAVCNNKFIASDGESKDYYGISTDLDGSRIVIGAYENNSSGVNSGAAYIYEYNGMDWAETKIVGSDTTDDDNYGVSVAMDGNFVVVGSPRDNNIDLDVGSIYVYEYNGTDWVETKIVPSDAEQDDFFGFNIDINGTSIVASSNSGRESSSGPASIYIYEYDGMNWNETKLQASDHFDGNHFGSSVSIHGNRVLVGAPRANGLVNGCGATYLYEKIGNFWKETKIIASDGDDTQDDFGVSVCVHQDKFVVGSNKDNVYDTHSGSVYLFEWTGNSWDETKLIPPTGRSSDLFGDEVSINENFILVSAPGYNDISQKFGAVYLFENRDNSWMSTRFLMPETILAQRYGSSLALNDSLFIVGASQDDVNGINSGSAFLYAPKKYFVDNDNDGFGIIDSTMIAWELTTGWSDNNLDCDDTNPNVNPNAQEIDGNEIDENCDGVLYENITCTSCADILNCGLFTCDAQSSLNNFTGVLPEFLGVDPQPDQPDITCSGTYDGAQNMTWFGFVAGSDKISLELEPIFCEPGIYNTIGMQFGILEACDIDNGDCYLGYNFCDLDNLDVMSFSAPLSVGKPYYIFIDGCGGSVCEYMLGVESVLPYKLDTPTMLDVRGCNTNVLSDNTFEICNNTQIEIIPMHLNDSPTQNSSYEDNGYFNPEFDIEFTYSVSPPTNGDSILTHNSIIDSTDNFLLNILNDTEAPLEFDICLESIDSYCEILFCDSCCINIKVLPSDSISFGEHYICEDELLNGWDPGLVNNYDWPAGLIFLDEIPDNNILTYMSEDSCGCNAEYFIEVQPLSSIDYYLDFDLDGYGNSTQIQSSCSPPVGYVLDNTDCNDQDENINPGVNEIPNNTIDEDCDGVAEIIDLDGDGWNSDFDCDDTNAAINPGAMEVPGNGIDEDCDGMDGTVSIHEIDGHSVDIYPNPMSEFLYVDSSVTGLRYSFYNYKGQVVLQGTVDLSPINISILNSGLYLIVIESDSGAFIVERLVKQ